MEQEDLLAEVVRLRREGAELRTRVENWELLLAGQSLRIEQVEQTQAHFAPLLEEAVVAARASNKGG